MGTNFKPRKRIFLLYRTELLTNAFNGVFYHAESQTIDSMSHDTAGNIRQAATPIFCRITNEDITNEDITNSSIANNGITNKGSAMNNDDSV